MNVVILDWDPQSWRDVRAYLELTTGDVYNETGIDPYYVENGEETNIGDKYQLARYYNRLLKERQLDMRMSTEP